VTTTVSTLTASSDAAKRARSPNSSLTARGVRPGAERDVEQHHVEAARARPVDRGAPVRDGHDVVPVALEEPPDLLAQLRFVIDDEDVERLGGQHGNASAAAARAGEA
jgi:hypothetical protein